jgi:Holliday junction resolvase
MPINSKQKGAKGERELAKVLTEYGYPQVRRSQQYCGSNGDADLVGLLNIHIECKRVEKLNMYDAIDQAKHDSGKNIMRKGYPLPAVFHRKNDHEWLVTMCLDDWMRLYKGQVGD